MHILGTVNSLISVQLNHFQLLFIMRMVEMISEITTFLAQDLKHILGEDDEGSVAVGVLAPQIDASLLMPSVSQSRDCIGGDYESVVPDSSSIYSVGDLVINNQNNKAAAAESKEIPEDGERRKNENKKIIPFIYVRMSFIRYFILDDACTTVPSSSADDLLTDQTISAPESPTENSSSRLTTPVPDPDQQQPQTALPQQQGPPPLPTQPRPPPVASSSANSTPSKPVGVRAVPAINVMNSPVGSVRSQQVREGFI